MQNNVEARVSRRQSVEEFFKFTNAAISFFKTGLVFFVLLEKFRKKNKTFNESAVFLVYGDSELILYPGILKSQVRKQTDQPLFSWQLGPDCFHSPSFLVVITEVLLVTSTTCKFHACNKSCLLLFILGSLMLNHRSTAGRLLKVLSSFILVAAGRAFHFIE